MSWPNNPTDHVETRNRDIVIRIADWTRQSMESGEPAYDVEIYNKGVYEWGQSEVFALREYPTKALAKKAAIAFAQKKIEELLT